MQTGNIDFIYRNELDKAYFQHDMAHGKLKDLAKRTQSDKVLRDKAFKIGSDPKADGYQRGLASMVYRNNKGIKYLLCPIDLFSKYAQLVPLKDKSGISVVNAFQKIISKGRKPKKIWVNQGDESYSNLFESFLKINDIEMYSTYNEGKYVVAERFIRTLKNKIFKHMTDV